MGNLFQVIIRSVVAFSIVSIVWYIILVVANWKIFTKAGEAGWKSIVPFLNLFVLFKISWKTLMFWIMFGATFLGSVLTSFAGEDGGFLAILGAILTLAACVLLIINTHKLSKSFGHGIGFTLGLLLLSPIFTIILGFGKSEYIGPDGIRNESGFVE